MTDSMSTLEMLLHVDIFQWMPTPIIQEVLACAHTEAYVKGDVIFNEGDTGNDMYLVVNGAVELLTAVRPGHQARLALLDRGQIFGELSLFDDLPRSASAVAFVKTTLLRIPGEDFNRLLDERHALAPCLLRNMVKKLSLRLRDADVEIRELSRVNNH